MVFRSHEETASGTVVGVKDELVIPIPFSLKYDLSYILRRYSSFQMIDDEVQHK